MKIYVGHSRSFDYKKELYAPLRNSELNKIHDIVFPHEKSDKPFKSKEFLKSCDVMVAEISFPSKGLGIELTWAHSYNVPIIAIYRKGTKISNSMKSLTNRFVEYSNPEELVSGIERLLKEI